MKKKLKVKKMIYLFVLLIPILTGCFYENNNEDENLPIENNDKIIIENYPIPEGKDYNSKTGSTFNLPTNYEIYDYTDDFEMLKTEDGITYAIHLCKNTVLSTEIDVEEGEKIIDSSVNLGMVEFEGESLNIVYGDINKFEDNYNEYVYWIFEDISIKGNIVGYSLDISSKEPISETVKEKVKKEFNGTINEFYGWINSLTFN